MKALIYVQHLMGTGPAVRMAALAAALDRAGVETTLVTGNRLPPILQDGGYEIYELPFARARNAAGSSVVDDRGEVVGDGWKKRRRTRLLQIFEDVAPDILVVEQWPFGHRFFDFELEPLAEAAQARSEPPLVACSLRDVVSENDAPSEDEMIRRAREWLDVVLVNGDPDFLPLEASFGGVAQITDILRYTGYLHSGEEAPEPPAGHGENEVLVSCGGGSVGDLLLTRAVKARALSAARDLKWRILVGSEMDDLLLSRLAAEAGRDVVVERARRDFPNLLKRARLSVSQCGYNTLVDVVAAGCPAVFVPFGRSGGREQTLRAQAAASHVAAVVIPELDLSAEGLAAAIDQALGLEPQHMPVRLDGAEATVQDLLQLANAAHPPQVS